MPPAIVLVSCLFQQLLLSCPALLCLAALLAAQPLLAALLAAQPLLALLCLAALLAAQPLLALLCLAALRCLAVLLAAQPPQALLCLALQPLSLSGASASSLPASSAKRA